ncbi:DUF1802 family protein [Mastigocoleus testarum]|uniref:DUF1802 domain-containing protein n=1 Tax=Mastigocoleus testarum BC008 TaxID=371196 RepID=A0A0V7ZH12_9CYAN|nr:DUF1802 family protein [Mastigocoleus testarum]KST63743.1 hypothetical protein BC008_14920 [Mastigocoleus testarum BC008]
MTNDIVIYKALRLPAPDIEALLQGRSIVAISNTFINREKFALCSANTLMNPLPIERYYHINFLDIAQRTFAQLGTEKLTIKAWAKCEWCHDINPESIATLSRLTIWTKETLEETLALRKNIFLIYLRVYYLSEQIEISPKGNNKFIPLSTHLSVSDSRPILTDNIFATRKRQLEKLEPPTYPKLEEFLGVLSTLNLNNPAAKKLEEDIQVFLGWNTQQVNQQVNLNLAWINDIAALGNRSKEEEGKSNHQAGTDFENISRKALEFIGFKVDESYKGGAGGLDLYCSYPYPVVIECKSGKSIPNRSVEELLKLGGTHLGADKVLDSPKLIIGPNSANATQHTLKAAKEWKVSIIEAMSLQELAELKAQYPGSIDLIELRKYLEAGVVDHKIQEYTNEVKRNIEIRSHLVRLVKDYLQNSNMDSTGVDALHGAYFGSNPPQRLQIKEMHEILIELSSPLTGYLGRIKGKDWKNDKFYFLRDLSM